MKWHHTFAWGDEKEIHWTDLGDGTPETLKEAAKEECSERVREYEWSDKYRGIDYEIVEYPPVEVLEKMIKGHRAHAKRLVERADELAAIVTRLRGQA